MAGMVTNRLAKQAPQNLIARQIEPAIRLPLDRLRGLIRNYVALQSVVWALTFSIWFYWFASLVDYGPVWLGSGESPWLARAIMLALWIATSLWIVCKYGLLRWLVRWPYSSLALLVERYHPQIQSRLVTTVQAIELADSDSREKGDLISRELSDQTHFAALEAMSSLDVTSILKWRSLQVQIVLLVVVLIFSIFFVAWQPRWSVHWAKRFLALSNEPWPRLARLRIDGMEMEIPAFTGVQSRERYLVAVHQNAVPITLGRSATLKISADLSAVLVPETCSVAYRLAKGGSGRSSMRRLNAGGSRWQPFSLDGPPLESIDQPMDLIVSGGDVRLPPVHLDTVDNPLLANLSLKVTYPGYLQRSMRGMPTSETLAYQNGMRLPQGAQVSLIGKSNVDLHQVDYVAILATSAKDGPPQVQSLVVNGQQFQIPLGPLDESLLVEFRLWDEHHLCSDRILQYVLAAVLDDVPRIDFAMRGIGPAVTPNAVIPFASKIEDDHGVRDSWVELGLNAVPPIREAIQLRPDGRVDSKVDLRELAESGRLRAEVSSTLILSVAADDHFDLSGLPRIGRSSSIQLSVVTPDQLMVMLERRELAMRSRLELLLSELQQMRDLLQRIELSNSSAGPSPSVLLQTSSGKVLPQGEGSSPQGEPVDPVDSDSENQRSSRLQSLRAQQSLIQVRKSESELRGIEQEITQIRDELVNNRIDSQDRQDRLEFKVRQPVHSILDQHFGELSKQLTVLENNLSRGSVPKIQISQPIRITDQILVELQAVLQNMIDIQDFNELVDMVRGIIDDQKNLLDKTKSEQTKQVLELFKERN